MSRVTVVIVDWFREDSGGGEKGGGGIVTLRGGGAGDDSRRIDGRRLLLSDATPGPDVTTELCCTGSGAEGARRGWESEFEPKSSTKLPDPSQALDRCLGGLGR